MNPSAARKPADAPARVAGDPRWALLAAGVLLALAHLKWGNPVILDSLVPVPSGLMEWALTAWPASMGFKCLVLVLLTALIVPTGGWEMVRCRIAKAWAGGWISRGALVFPGLWLCWQLLAASGSAEPALTRVVLVQFTACTVLYYLGWLLLGGEVGSIRFWVPVVAGLALVFLSALDQHYGGLEQTRAMVRAQPGWEQLPADLLKRIEGNRVFGTLFYANALASLILLLFPGALAALWRVGAGWPRVLRGVAVGLFTYAGLGCLYWSGSKAGWLVAVALVGLWLWWWLPRGYWRWLMLLLVVGVSVGVFAVRFRAYFDKGATSAVARFDCWQAAITVASERPLLGSGPGTFGSMYRRLKKPEAEMSKLVHNDYLQQASDSGWVGMALYVGLVLCALARSMPGVGATDLRALVWLGLVGWALHSMVEFGLYIPAIGWTSFLLMGLMLGSKQIDRASSTA